MCTWPISLYMYTFAPLLICSSIHLFVCMPAEVYPLYGKSDISYSCNEDGVVSGSTELEVHIYLMENVQVLSMHAILCVYACVGRGEQMTNTMNTHMHTHRLLMFRGSMNCATILPGWVIGTPAVAMTFSGLLSNLLFQETRLHLWF